MYNISEEKIMQNWKGDFCKPVVSVCCTTYNHENYIAETIDGFLMQKSDFPFEILIRDDCSTDRTAEIVKQYAEQYPQLIKPIYEKENTFSKGVAPMRQLFKIAVVTVRRDFFWPFQSSSHNIAPWLAVDVRSKSLPSISSWRCSDVLRLP